MGLHAHAQFAYGSLMASRRSGRVVAQRLGLKGHVDDQVVVRVRRARYSARSRCTLERDDAEVINSPALQLRGNTGLHALCRGIKGWGRRVHMSATTGQRKHTASRTGGCVYQ